MLKSAGCEQSLTVAHCQGGFCLFLSVCPQLLHIHMVGMVFN